MFDPLPKPVVDTDIKEPSYVSQDGFEKVPIIRGFYEIEPLFNTIKKYSGMLMGGYVRWMCSPADQPILPGDIDVYFCSEGDYDRCKEDLLNEGLQVKHENVVSCTFAKATVDSKYRGCPDIQLIKPIEEGNILTMGSMESILDNFDFSVVRAGVINKHTAMVDKDFLHDEARKILRLKNIHCPVGSTLRCMKYSKKGYWLPPTQVFRLFVDWDNRTAEYKEKLYDFVTKANDGTGLSQKEIDEMEAMFRVD
jgi:hypothetical protein